MNTGPAFCACCACRLSVVSAGVVLRDVCRCCGLTVKETSPSTPLCCVFGSLRERNIAPARHCVVCSMAFVKEKPPLLGKIVEKSVVLGEQGRLIFHADRRNPEQGRYFFHSTPIAMRHGGNARRVSVSVSFPWAQQMIAMRWTSAVRETCRWRHTTSRLASITDAHDERKFALLWLALTEA